MDRRRKVELFEEIRREHAHGSGTILREDRTTPRKQRHTAHRIWERIQQERSGSVAEATVRRYVRGRKQELGVYWPSARTAR